MTGLPAVPPQETIQQVVSQLAARVPGRDLARASAELSLAYRSAGAVGGAGGAGGAGGRGGGGSAEVPVGSDLAALAYLVTRFPATFAASRRALELSKESSAGWRPRSLVDVGAGPGTAALAAASTWPDLERALLLEPGRHMRSLGEELCARLGLCGPSWRWGVAEPGEPGEPGELTGFDVVAMAYVLGEAGERADDLVALWWERCSGLIVVVEPGTPAGFGVVRRVRSLLVSLGGTVVAPCPHEADCPMGEGDWCHFGVRLSRSSLHRRMKAGEVGWEDEKFSFAAVARPALPGGRSAGRILRRPGRQRRRVELSLCTEAGLERATIGRSSPLYRRAVKSAWGDAWPDASASRV